MLPTLLAALTISGIAAVLQAEDVAFTKAVAQLERVHMEAAGAAGALELARGEIAAVILIGGTAGNARPNGSSWNLEFGTSNWIVQVQDTAGLFDLYLTKVESLEKIGLNADVIEARRKIASTENKIGRWFSEAQGIARFDIPEELHRWITHHGSARINILNLPVGLPRALRVLYKSQILNEEVLMVKLRVIPSF